MRVHQLKTWPEPFQAVLDGRKRHEYRVDDREFEVGDHLRLVEWNPGLTDDGELDAGVRGYTGRETMVVVTYLSKGAFAIPTGYVVMSVELVP